MSPCKGDNLLRRGSLSFEVKCPGRTVCFEVKCPGDSLLRSNLPPGHFTSGGKLLRDKPTFCLCACPLLQKETVPAARVVNFTCALRSQANGRGIWPGNETSCAHAYKIRKWRPSQRTASLVPRPHPAHARRRGLLSHPWASRSTEAL